MISKYNEEDIKDIENIGLLLHDNYKFNLDVFSSCYTYKINNKIIGFITYSVIYDRAEIIDVIIIPEYRRQRYAKELISKVINDVKGNCKNVTLEVRKGNVGATKLYELIGFKVVATRNNYYNNEDGLLMELDLEVK